jgi:L-rhamnose mutarotase
MSSYWIEERDMIVALHSVLREGAEADYELDHQRIPADLEASFARLGIYEWSIWRSGRNLFHLVDCEDWLGAMKALEDDPANLAWQAHIGRHVDYFIGEEDGAAGQVLPLVYSLQAQRAADWVSG